MPTKSAEVKRLEATHIAQSLVRSVRSLYQHAWAEPTRVSLTRAARHASALNMGLLACPAIVVGVLPERPTRAAQTQPWERMRFLAMVVEGVAQAIGAAIHVLVASAVVRTVPGELRRSDVFADAAPGAPEFMLFADAVELQRAMSALALGLRAAAERDVRVWKARYAALKARITHPVVGPMNPFVYARTVSLDSLTQVLESLRDGVAPARVTDLRTPGEAEAAMMMRAAGLDVMAPTATASPPTGGVLQQPPAMATAAAAAAAAPTRAAGGAASTADPSDAATGGAVPAPAPAPAAASAATAASGSGGGGGAVSAGGGAGGAPGSAAGVAATGGTRAGAAAATRTPAGAVPRTPPRPVVAGIRMVRRDVARHGVAVNLGTLAADYPWFGIGAAVAQGMGDYSRTAASKAWDAFDAHEGLTAQSLKALGLAEAPTAGSKRERGGKGDGSDDSSADASAGGADGGGGHGGGKGKGKKSKSARRKAAAKRATAAAVEKALKDAGLAAGGGGGGSGGGGGARGAGAARGVDRAAARAALIGKDFDDYTVTDCLDAHLCFRCKKPMHPRTDACDLRGAVLRAPGATQ